MPLILLSGYPSSGLTRRAQQIITHFKSDGQNVPANLSIQHISDDTLGIPRTAYDTARTEKDARAALSSAVKRHLGRETLVVCDAMNYIKGFRYQMWCEAKAAGTPCCVVHVAANPEQATNLHNMRLHDTTTTPPASPDKQDTHPPQPPPYTSTTFTNLISRYEEPSASARWDSPLFTVPHSDADPPYDAIASALFSNSNTTKTRIKTSTSTSTTPSSGLTTASNNSKNSSASPSSSIQQPDGSKPPLVKPHLATVAPKQMPSDALYTLEKATSDIVKAVLAYMATAGISECAGETLSLPGHSIKPGAATGDTDADADAAGATLHALTLTLTLPHTGTLSVAHLQRLKRQFVSLYRARGVGMGAASSGGVGALGAAAAAAASADGRSVSVSAASSDVDGVRRAFVGFLQSAFDAED